MARSSDVQRMRIQEMLTGYDEATVEIIWEIVNEKSDESEYRSIQSYSFSQEAQNEWAYFIVLRNEESEILAIKCDVMKTARVTDLDHLAHYDASQCVKIDTVVYAFRVKTLEDGNFVSECEKVKYGQRIEFRECRYVGIMRLSLPGIKAIMGMLAWNNSRGRRFDCLDYCKDFVQIYNILTGNMASFSNPRYIAESVDGLTLAEPVEPDVNTPTTEDERETEINNHLLDTSSLPLLKMFLLAVLVLLLAYFFKGDVILITYIFQLNKRCSE